MFAVLAPLTGWGCLALLGAAQPAASAAWPIGLMLCATLAVLAISALAALAFAQRQRLRLRRQPPEPPSGLRPMGQGRDAASAQRSVGAARPAEAGPALPQAGPLQEAVFHSAAIAMIVSDVRGLIQAVNPAAERLLGRCAAQLVGQATLASLHDRQDLPLLAKVLREHLPDARNGQTRGPAQPRRGGEQTLHYRRGDGSRRPVSVTVSALRDEGGQVAGFVCFASDITERLQRAERLSHQAHHDALTGLPNRHLLEQHLHTAMAQATQDRRPLALVFIDLDNFKPVNDRHGHAVGDAVLCEVARRLQSQCRDRDLVARLGGDEFVLVLNTLAQASDAKGVADRLMQVLTQPMAVAGHRVQVGASIGLAHHPEGGGDPQALLRAADARMYAIKHARRQMPGQRPLVLSRQTRDPTAGADTPDWPQTQPLLPGASA